MTRLGTAIHRPKADIAIAREAYGSALAAWMRLTSRTPTELAKLIRVSSSATISRWTTGVASPRQEHREALRALGFEGP